MAGPTRRPPEAAPTAASDAATGAALGVVVAGPAGRLPRRDAGLRPLLRRALVGLLGPLLLYYLLRLLGVAPAPALVLSNTPAALWTAYCLLTRRAVDKVAIAGLAATALGAALTLATADPRLVFGRSALITGGVGIWVLTTARGPRPAALRLTRPLLERIFHQADWDGLWAAEPAFRRLWRVTTVLVGSVQLLDATLRATLAWTVPLDMLPAVTTATNLTVGPVLLALVNGYQVRAGLYRMPGFERPFRPRRRRRPRR